MAKSIYDWFNNHKNIKFVDQLLKYGVVIKQSQATSQHLSNQTFVLTGSLDSLDRNEAKQKIRALGGNISSSVSAQTDYLVIGQEPGSKYDKAKELGIKIITEKEFLDILK